MPPTLPSGFASTPTPTFAFAVRLGVGPAAAPSTGMKIMLLASKTSAGTASNNIPVEVFDATDAEAQFGARSRLAAKVRAFRAIAPRGRLFACPVADPVGGVAATAVLTFAGPSTAAGVVRLRIAGRLIREVVIPSGTSASAAAALVLAALAEVSELPCTGAVGGTGAEHVLTLAAANPGQVGNQLRVVFEVTATGITIALNELAAATRGKAYFGSGGSSATAGRSTGSATFPVRLVNGDTVIVSRNGAGNATATFAGFARRLLGVSGTLAAVTAGHSLVLVVHGTQRSVAFAGTENSAVLYAAAINAIPGITADTSGGQVRITTDKQGSGASLSVHASTDADVLASLGFTSGQVGTSLGSSNVADIEAITAAEFESIVEGAVAGTAAGADADGHPYIESTTTGTGSTIQVQASSTADDEFGFDNNSHAGTAGYSVAGVGTVDLTAALAAIAGARYHRIVADVDDDTNRGRLKNHLVSQSAINVGQRCMGVAGSIEETLATAQADAVAQNEPRLTLVYNRRSHNHCGELAAAYMAAKVYGDGRLPGEEQYLAAKANSLSLYPAILATDEEERLTGTQVDTLLRAGVSPLGADNLNPGYAAVVRPVTTRTQNAQGGTSYLVADTSKVAVADAVADRCEAWAASNYADKNLVPDPVTIEQAPSSPYVVWPSAVRDDFLAILRQMEGEFLIVNVAQYASQVTVEQATIDGVTYLVCRVPFAVINHLHSVVGEAQQVA